MPRRFLAAWAVLAAVALAGCWSEPELPPRPVMLAHQPDTLWSEDGIDAVPEGSWIQVQWLGLADRSVAGYKLFRFSYDDQTLIKTAPDSLVADIPQATPVPETVTWTDQRVLLDKRYAYYVQSYDENGTESERSEMADYKLVNKVPLLAMQTPRGDSAYTAAPEFVFGDLSADVSIRAVVVKVWDVNTQSIIWVSGQIDPFNASVLVFNANGTALVDTLTHDRSYRWRIDVIGRDQNSGSESQWIDFTVLSD